MTKPPAPIRVVLVDDSTLVREGLRSVLGAANSLPAIEVVGEAGTGADGVAEAARLKPDVILLDIRLPDGSGLDVCRRILREVPKTHVLILTSHSDDSLIYEAIRAGAQGFLVKEIDPTGLISAIRSAAAGKSVLAPEVTDRVMRLLRTGATGEPGSDLSTLSPQEGRVLALVAAGKTNKEIAEEMKLSDNTVKNYLMSVFEKLQVKRRSQAAALYAQRRT